MSSSRRLRRVFRWSAAVALLALVVGIWLVARAARVPTVVAERKPLEEHVVASGRVRPPARIDVSCNVGGLVLALGAMEGTHAKRGDLLVQIDDAEARAQVAQASGAVDQATAKVDQLRRVGSIVAGEGLKQAQANLDKARADFERMRSLVASGSETRVQLEEAQRALDVARAQKTAAEAQQLGSAPMGADTRVALAALLQAQAQLTAAQDGVVLTRSVEVGDTVQPGRTLMTMAADGPVELTFEPDERNLAAMALGQKAKASADAFPRQTFDAEVSYIAPSVDPARGTIEVRLRVPSPPAYLKPDMTVSIDLTVATKGDALVVRSDAVRGLSTPAPWVLVVDRHRAARRDVKVGIEGDGHLEILAGIAPGARVILPSGNEVRPGQRVRAARAER